MNPWMIFSLLSRAFLGEETGIKECTNSTEVMDYLLLRNRTYNKFKIPRGGLEIEVQIWVQEVSSVSELTQDFEIDLYLNEIWHDPQLNYEHLNPCKKQNITVDRSFYEKLWTPNTVFINSKSASIHKSPFENIFLMIYPNGTVWANYRMKLTGPCDMKLQNFPMDKQKCFLTFESFNYNTEEVKMRWHKEEPITLIKTIELPDFFLTNFTASREEVTYPAGMWDELTVTFWFTRRYGFYFLQGYVPTYLTVFISWISFYLGTKTIPARTMLCVNALLAMTFQFGNLMRNLPKVSYVKAIDVWMLSSMTFIFGSLIELAIIGYLTRHEEGPKKHHRSDSAAYGGLGPINRHDFDLSNPTLARVKFASLERSKGRFTYAWACLCPSHAETIWKPEKIDKFSMMMFPTLFFIFNIAYWGYYLGVAQTDLTVSAATTC